MDETSIFRALSDPTRRSLYEKLSAGASNASGLREGLAISQPAVSQHLKILREAGLIVENRHGRFVIYEVNPEGLALLVQWLAKYRAYWPKRMDDLKNVLKDMDQ